MKHLFFVVVNKTAHTCWWPWPTPTLALRATHIEHGMESKRGWQFYTILPRKLIKPLMLKYLWVLPHLKNQSSSTISAGDWKLVSEMTFQRISKSLHTFKITQFQHMKQLHSGLIGHILTLEMSFLTFYCKHSHIFISPTCMRSTITKMQASEY